MRCVVPCLLACAMAGPAPACETALVLAVDVSASISPSEYQLQVNGLADALADPEIIRAILVDADSLALVQWSGSDLQALPLPWTSPANQAEVADLALLIRTMPRPDRYTNTAIGPAVRFSSALFAGVPGCRRKVIDVSGDGQENDGMTLNSARREAARNSITINGLAIEAGTGYTFLTDYYRRYVVTPDGFVVTATSIQDFPRAIHEKLLRELTHPIS